MRKTMPKASYFDASYQRRDLYDKGPTQGSLRTNKREPGALSKTVLVEGGSMGVAAAYGGHLKPSNVLSHQGIPPTLPVFDGQPGSSLILWLVQIKSYFLSQYIPKSVWCEMAESYLKGHALVWYYTLDIRRRKEGKERNKSWHKLEIHMKRKYLPLCELTELKAKLEEVRQELLSLNEDIKAERKHLNVDHERSDEGIDLTHSKPLQLPNNDLIPTHCESKDQSPNQNPKEAICCVSTNLQQNSQPNFYFTTEFHESITMPGLGEDPYFSLCPKMNHLNPNNKPHPKYETCVTLDEKPKPCVLNNSKRNVFPNGDTNQMTGCWPELSVMSVWGHGDSRSGMNCTLLTPHFHSHMLLTMQISLEHLAAISCTIRVRNGFVSSNNRQLSLGNAMRYLKQYGNLKSVSWVLSKLLRRMAMPEMITLDHSKWKLNFNGVKDCPALNLHGLWVEIVGIPCRNVLELLGKSNAKPLPSLGEIPDTWELFKRETQWELSKSKPPENSWIFTYSNQPTLLENNPFFILSPHQKETHPLAWLGHIRVWLFLNFPQKVEKPDGKRVFDPGGRTNASLRRHSEFGKVHGLIEMHLIMVFDPGGSMPHPNFEMIRICFCQTRCIANLRTNFFQAGVVAAGAKAMGLSFLKPRNIHEMMPSKITLECLNFVQNRSSQCLKCFHSDTRISANFKGSQMEFYSMKIHFVCVYRIVGKSNFHWNWNGEGSTSRFPTNCIQRLSRFLMQCCF